MLTTNEKKKNKDESFEIFLSAVLDDFADAPPTAHAVRRHGDVALLFGRLKVRAHLLGRLARRLAAVALHGPVRLPFGARVLVLVVFVAQDARRVPAPRRAAARPVAHLEALLRVVVGRRVLPVADGALASVARVGGLLSVRDVDVLFFARLERALRFPPDAARAAQRVVTGDAAAVGRAVARGAAVRRGARRAQRLLLRGHLSCRSTPSLAKAKILDRHSREKQEKNTRLPNGYFIFGLIVVIISWLRYRCKGFRFLQRLPFP